LQQVLIGFEGTAFIAVAVMLAYYFWAYDPAAQAKLEDVVTANIKGNRTADGKFGVNFTDEVLLDVSRRFGDAVLHLLRRCFAVRRKKGSIGLKRAKTMKWQKPTKFTLESAFMAVSLLISASFCKFLRNMNSLDHLTAS
jgi:hypothetical protein